MSKSVVKLLDLCAMEQCIVRQVWCKRSLPSGANYYLALLNFELVLAFEMMKMGDGSLSFVQSFVMEKLDKRCRDYRVCSILTFGYR